MENLGRKLVWLASYPKSGNTWVRLFLASYLRELDSSFVLNSSFWITRSDSRRAQYEKVANSSIQDFTEPELDQLRGKVQRQLAHTLQPPTLVKTHNARIRRNGYSLVPTELTLGAIYVVRNPLDVVDSVADHFGISVDRAIELMADASRRIGDTRSPLVTQHISSWSLHVNSWISHSEFPVHLVRYEELRASPFSAFRNLLTFLGWKIDQHRLTRAIDETQFEKLQHHESIAGFDERSDKSKSGVFFRRGCVDGWKGELSDDQVERIRGEHQSMMRKLRYIE